MKVLYCFVLPALCVAGDVKPLDFPAPQTTGGKPLLEALKARQSTREFSSRTIAPQVLSNLLWAAAGINRPDGRRTAPSASNLRPLAGTQDYVASAPITLVYVADLARYTTPMADQDKLMYSGADTGFIGQNVYLFCASEGLATVVRASIDRPALAKAMHLRAEQRIMLDQPVGYPK